MLAEQKMEMLAERFRVLGDVARLRILHVLGDGELTVTELMEATKLGQANLSKHLQILHAAGFVERRREGVFVHYRQSGDCVLEVCGSMGTHLSRQAARQRRALARTS
jgi:DNA-binding transcriptional ArsR family regulator